MPAAPPNGILCVDIETSSACDIKNGSWAYSQHPSTEIYTVCWGFARRANSCRIRTWVPGEELIPSIRSYIENGGKLLAHNAGFEASIFQNILTPVFGWPEVDLDQWVDTQPLGLGVNFPPALEGLAKALGCSVQKDKVGAKLMKAMAHAVPDDDGGWIRDRNPAHLKRLIRYCVDDVRATLDCYFRLPDLIESEAALERVDRRINHRGVFLDQEFAANCSQLVQERGDELADEAGYMSHLALENSTSTPPLKRWLQEEKGLELPTATRINVKGERKTSVTLDANAVARILKDPELDRDVRGVLLNRQEANKITSLKKLQRVPTMVGTDGRLRFALGFCGASTGRWTSHGLQLHNLPKNHLSDAESRLNRLMIDLRSLEGLKLATERPLDAVSQALRSVLAAAPGREIIAGDYAAIEARVVAWLAGQDNITEQFARGVDVYTYTAANIGSSSRQLGKICVLALGYGMGALKFVDTAAKWNIPLDRKEGLRVQRAWREANPQIVAFWHELEDAVRFAIDQPGKIFDVEPCRYIRVVVKQDCLFVRLPSGRSLRYWKPHLKWAEKKIQVIDDDGSIVTRTMRSEEIRFFSVAKSKKGMAIDSTYSGKLAENVCQAVARDLLGAALVRIDAFPIYDLVVHVHDSAASEVDAGKGSVEEFCALMAEAPSWAKGLPISVEGYRDLRFRG